MDFIKKHYEKVLLGAVLLSLAVAVVFLPFYINSQKQDLVDKRNQRLNPSVKPLPNLDETRFSAAEARLETPAPLNLSKPHNLFNPVPWQKKPDGVLLKIQEGNEVGPEALSILSICRVVITSLYLPKPYSSFLVASKGCQPVATMMAPTFNLKSWGS